MSRLTENIVFCGFVTAWRFAVTPTYRSPPLPTATMEGVVRMPSLFSNTLGWPASTIAIAEFVVPKSIPSIFGILFNSRWTNHPAVHDVSGADFGERARFVNRFRRFVDRRIELLPGNGNPFNAVFF